LKLIVHDGAVRDCS